MLMKYLRPVLFALVLFTMVTPSTFALGRSRRDKKCVEQCKADRHSAEASCVSMQGEAKSQCMTRARMTYKTCKKGCPKVK